MSRQRELDRRQQQLLLRCAEGRLALAEAAAPLRPPLAVADQIRDAWLWLRMHPEVPVVAGVVVLVLRPRRAVRWGLQLWTGWRLLRRYRRHPLVVAVMGAHRT